MASDRPSIPMLEAYLRQVQAPPGRVLSEKVDWPLTIVVFCGVCALPVGEWTIYPAIALAWLTIHLLRSYRRKQVALQQPDFRVAWERWTRVSRVASLIHDRRLVKRAPPQVLMALEQAARTWHDARESLSAVSVTDPAFAEELQGVIDASMGAAVGAAEPVVLRDEQNKRDLQKMIDDHDLMDRVCTRIAQEQTRMGHLVPEARGLIVDTPGTLRKRLEIAQQEREAAEAELDSYL